MQENMKILIVDDEPLNIEILTSALIEHHQVISAANGHKAISLVKEENPDLILLDVMMPNMNGFDVCRILKAEEAFAHIPIIFLTALDSFDAQTEGLNAGGIDYLPKPVNLVLLQLRVKNHLELKHQNDLVRDQRDQLARQARELEEALQRVKRLEGIIPICMYCKSIRTDKDYWEELESYFHDHTEAQLTHGICPDCIKKHYPDLEL